MSSDPRRPPGRLVLALSLVAAIALHGCGYKKPPTPPPRKIPQKATVTVHQRGLEAILTFDYPTITISGTPLEGISRVDVYRLRLEVPAFAYDLLEQEAQQRREAEALLEEHGLSPQAVEGGEEEGAPGADGDPIAAPEASVEEPVADVAEVEPLVEEVIDETAVETATGQIPETDDDGTVDEDGSSDDDGAEELSPEEQLEIQIDAARALLRSPPTQIERYLTATMSDFRRDAELLLQVDGDALAGSVVGDEITLRTPIPPIPPSRPRAEPAAEPADADADREGDASEATAEPERDPQYGYLYSVVLHPLDGKPSDYSQPVALFPVPPPAPPVEVTVTAQADGVRIDWTLDDDPEQGFRVYRREARSRLYGDPLSSVVAPARTFTDRQAVYGSRYIYGVTAVGRSQPLLESELSSEHEVDYQDRFGPPTPTGLVAFPEVGRVRLLWDASQATDLAGYRVLRSGAGDAPEPLGDELVARSQYLDEAVTSGDVWFYSVVAVDELGNESAATAEIQVTVP